MGGSTDFVVLVKKKRQARKAQPDGSSVCTRRRECIVRPYGRVALASLVSPLAEHARRASACEAHRATWSLRGAPSPPSPTPGREDGRRWQRLRATPRAAPLDQRCEWAVCRRGGRRLGRRGHDQIAGEEGGRYEGACAGEGDRCDHGRASEAPRRSRARCALLRCVPSGRRATGRRSCFPSKPAATAALW